MLVRAYLICGLALFFIGCTDQDQDIPTIIADYGVGRRDTFRSAEPEVDRHVAVNGNVPSQWVPPSRLENKGRWRGILIHHSDSSYGCAAHEAQYHKSLGWDGLGYHFVINNGVYRHGYGKRDGLVEVGYRWSGQKTGSHCRVNGDSSNYYNEHTIGICLIGDFEYNRPTENQMRSLAKLVNFLQDRYGIAAKDIKGHGDVKPTKCPGRYFSFWDLRRRL